MPMRFADLDGTMIDVYQATTQMTDESEPELPAPCRHAPRQRSRRRGLLRRLHGEHAHRSGRQHRLRRHPRLGASPAACRSCPRSRCSSGSTGATRRASAASRGAATRSRSRSPCGAGANNLQAMVPETVGRRRAHRDHAGRQSRHLHRADHQGRRVRVLRRDGRRLRRAVRRRHDSARHLRGGCDPGQRRRRDGHLDDRRGLDLDRGLRDFGRLARLPGRATALW